MTQNTKETKTIAPEREPEYVGAHSARVNPDCQGWHQNDEGEMEQCGECSTHTVVMFSGDRLHQIAMCDDCGEPEDVDNHEREWTGDLLDP